MHGRLTAARELPVAQILVDEGRGGRGIAAPLDHFLEGAAPVESRACSAPIPTFAYPVGLLGGPHARLEVGKLHFLPQPIDDIVDLEFEQQLHFALVLAASSLLAGTPLLG